MIHINNLTFEYPKSSPVFQEFSLDIQKGETWSILGPSGCGKSTLLYLLAGLRCPTSGQIRIDDQLLTRPRPQTGLIIQEYGLLPWSTVRQNVEIGLQIRGFYGPDGTHAPDDLSMAPDVDYWIERLRLTLHHDKYPSQLSGGQRQRTAIARTLVLEPDLLLMDEPFSSLDAPTRENLQALTLELQSEQQLTLVIVTHSIEEAAILGRKIILLRQPPNSNPLIIENPGASQADFYNSPDYIQICRDLRKKMTS